MHRRWQPKEQFHVSYAMDPRDLDHRVTQACPFETLPPLQDLCGEQWCIGSPVIWCHRYGQRMLHYQCIAGMCIGIASNVTDTRSCWPLWPKISRAFQLLQARWVEHAPPVPPWGIAQDQMICQLLPLSRIWSMWMLQLPYTVKVQRSNINLEASYWVLRWLL